MVGLSCSPDVETWHEGLPGEYVVENWGSVPEAHVIDASRGDTLLDASRTFVDAVIAEGSVWAVSDGGWVGEWGPLERPQLAWSDSVPARALSVSVHEERIGLWDWSEGKMTWIDRDRPRSFREWFPNVSTEALFPAGMAVHSPPRSHGRIASLNGDSFLLETRDPATRLTSGTSALLVVVRGASADTIRRIMTDSYSFSMGAERVCCMRARALAPQPHWDVSVSGWIAVSDGRRGEVAIIDAAGSLIDQIVWTVPSQRVDRRLEASMVRGHYLAGAPEAGDRAASSAVRRYLDRRDDYEDFFAYRVPAVTQLIVDDLSRVWVRRFDDRIMPEGLSRLWDVFDREGVYLGVVRIPIGGAVFDIANHAAVGVDGPGESGATELLLARVPMELRR